MMRSDTLSRYVSEFFALMITALMLAASPPLSGQAIAPDPTATGHVWVLAFPDTTANTIDTRYPNGMLDVVHVLIYSATDGNTVEIRSNGNLITKKTLKGGTFEQIPLKTKSIVDASDEPSRLTYRVESDQPILIYCYFATKFGAEAWTPLPVERWGTEYYAAAPPGEVLRDISEGGEFNFNSRTKAAPAEILVVAAYDSTVVAIEANDSLTGGRRTRNVMLMANQAYQVQSFVDTAMENFGIPQPNLSGSRITASRPIGVISGATRAQLMTSDIGLGQNSFKNSLFEWLAPVEQHGTEFAYLPTWDAYRQINDPKEKPDGVRPGEHLWIYGTSKGITGITYDSAQQSKTLSVDQKAFVDVYRTLANALYLRTDRPAQVMMAPVATVKFNGTQIYWGGYVGASYNASATPYMVELTPREQWINFAPFYTPKDPGNMNHYINVVTDSASAARIVYKIGPPNSDAEQRFPFNRGQISGSDLVWGTMELVAGNQYYIRGLDSAVRFGGFVYGSLQGYELFRPGKTRKFGDPPSTADGGKRERGPGVLHPAEYEEATGISYGYPLAPARRTHRSPDSLVIDTVRQCRRLNFTVTIVNANPSGLASVRLAPSSQNVTLTYADPTTPSGVIGRAVAQFSVAPIDSTLDASATVLISDRAGRTWSVAYISNAAALRPSDPQGIDLGEVNLNSCEERSLTFYNELSHGVRVDAAVFAQGTEGFTVIGTEPPIPADIPAGGTLKIRICNTPPRGEGSYLDSLTIMFGCQLQKLSVQAEGVKPCITVGDISFGKMHLGDPEKILPLRICNQGRGTVEFNDPDAQGVVQWLERNFNVSKADLDLLKNSKIKAGSCVTIRVAFQPPQEGWFQTTARFRTNTTDCRDSSVWLAIVVPDSVPLAVPAPASAGYRLRQNDPNPFIGSTTLSFSLGMGGETRVAIYDASGSLVTTLLDDYLEAGEHQLVWDASGLPSGHYHCRIVSGSWHHDIIMALRK